MPLFRTKRLLIFIIIVFTHNLDTAIFAQGWTTQRRRPALIEQGPSFPSHQATGGWSQTQSFNITTKIIQDNCIENSAFIVLHVAFKILQYPHPGKITSSHCPQHLHHDHHRTHHPCLKLQDAPGSADQARHNISVWPGRCLCFVLMLFL